MDDETSAIQKLKRGDISSLEPLVLRYQDQAIRSAYLIVQNKQLARDIVQTSFVRVAERIHQFNERRPFAPWFFRIVINQALTCVARNKRFVSLEQLPTDTAWLADWYSDPAQILEQNERSEKLRELLQELSPEQRAVIVLRYYLDFSLEEIASELETPPGTVKSRLYTARQRLKYLIQGLNLSIFQWKESS